MNNLHQASQINGFDYVVTDEQMRLYAKMSDLERLEWVESARIFTLLSQTPVTKVRHEALRKGLTQNNTLKKIKRGRPAGTTKKDTKVAVKLRLNPEVLKAFRATGRGWQTRINDLVVSYINSL